MDFKVGQEVEVTRRGTVTQVFSDSFQIHFESGGYGQFYPTGKGISVKIIKEPVETYGPGSIVKNVTTGRVFTVIDNMYVWDHHHNEKITKLHSIDSNYYIKLA